MTKRNKKKTAKNKESLPEGQEQPKKLQVWGLQETQKAVLIQAQNRYASEVKVITSYQEDNWKRIVREVAKELGIPERINARLNYDAMTFTELPPEPEPPKASPITQDLTKVLEKNHP